MTLKVFQKLKTVGRKWFECGSNMFFFLLNLVGL